MVALTADTPAYADSGLYDDFSQTGQTPYTYCAGMMKVFAYFCGSDNQWYTRSSGWVSGTNYGAVNTPPWNYWTNRVYGYHSIQEPLGYASVEITTDAFEGLTCT